MNSIIGTGYILIGAAAVPFLKPALESYGKPGSRSFIAFGIGVAIYAICTGLNLFTESYELSVLAQNVTNSAGVLIGVAWLCLTLRVSDRVTVTRRLTAVLAAYVLFGWVLALVNPGGITIQSTSTMAGTRLDISPGIGFWFLLGTGQLQVAAGTGLLAVESLRSTGLRRRQTGLLALAIIPGLVASVFTASTLRTAPVGYDYTVFGWAVSLVMFAVALYSGRFLDVTTVARRTATEEMTDAMITLDEENRVLDANRRARTLFDIDGDYGGTPATEFFQPISQQTLSQLLETDQGNTDISMQRDGVTRYFSLSVSPVTDRPAQARVVLLHDITAQKQTERKLRLQNERLDRFADIVSHDLRNPLHIADGYLDLAKETGDEENFQKVRDAHRRMDTMIEELRTMARAENIVDDKQTLELKALAVDAWQTAQTDGATLEMDIDEDVVVEGTGELLRNVFENLFRNAVDHNEPPITVRVGALGGNPEGFYVEDTGEGIAEDRREEVFEHGYTTSEEGTGFGLSVVSDLISAHEWNITLTESSDGGARFEIRTEQQGN